jgi:hypothetical protein
MPCVLLLPLKHQNQGGLRASPPVRGGIPAPRPYLKDYSYKTNPRRCQTLGLCWR